MKLDILTDTYLNRRYKALGFTHIPDNKQLMSLRLSDTPHIIPLANALRRIMSQELPIYAIDPDLVDLEYNSSAMHDDVIKDRLSLIPINNQLNIDYDDLVFELEVSNKRLVTPSEVNQSVYMHITAHDYLKVSTKSQLGPPPVTIQEIIPQNHIIMVLPPNKGIKLRCSMKKGIGKNHARWSSAIVMYKFETEQDKTLAPETVEQQAQFIGREENAMPSQSKPSAILLTVESVGVLDASTIVSRALDQLKHKAEHIKALLPSLKAENKENMWVYTLVDEDLTIGGLLQSVALSNNGDLFAPKYPHPLDNKLELWVQATSGGQAMDRIISALDEIINIVDQLSNQFPNLESPSTQSLSTEE